MGLFDFVKDAGEKLFGDKPSVEEEKATAEKLTERIKGFGLAGNDVKVELKEGVATVKGAAATQQDREKIALVLGNTAGVGQVDDQLAVEKPAPAAKFYTVKSGDSLSKIAKEHYGEASKYMKIFEANTPMLKDPDKIFPGQVLRVPAE